MEGPGTGSAVSDGLLSVSSTGVRSSQPCACGFSLFVLLAV